MKEVRALSEFNLRASRRGYAEVTPVSPPTGVAGGYIPGWSNESEPQSTSREVDFYV